MAKKLPVLSNATKSVLPEVLPDPRRPKEQSAPRSRTVAHMQRLLATAAAVGVATVSCGKEKTATDPSGERQGCGKKPGSSGDPSSSSGQSSGYAVVDPMPPPAHCPDVAPTVKATATWIQGDGGALLLDVFFPNPPRADYKYVKDAQPTVYTGTMTSHTVKDDGVHVFVTPDPTAKNTSVSVKGTCDKGPGTLTANVSWAEAPKVGGVTVVYVSEY